MSEAGVHFDFYFHLRGAIEADPQRGQRTYDRVEPEYTSEDLDGRADLVLFDTSDSPALVIEAKRPGGAPSRDIDPYAPAVIKQAHGYASQLGTPYFATFNGDRLVLFNTHEQGVPLLQRSTKSYEIGETGQFANTLLDEIARLEAERISWDSLDDAFIERVRTLHDLLAPELENELTTKLSADSEFRESFVTWASAQGIEYDDASATRQTEVRERFAEEGAYLLANKILFYKILEAAPAYSADVRPLAIRPNHARADLEDYFEEIVANIDFEAVFEHDSIYSEIPLTSIGERLNEFIDELDDQDLTQFDSDVIGRIYEGVIPPGRRHEMGEYYTPPAICDLITRLTVDEGTDEVFDPACGSGGFLISAYNRKKTLLPEEAGGHEQILTQLYGVDINRFPAHLSAINLSIQDLTSHTETVNVEVSDFFDIDPDTLRFGRVRAGAGGDEWVSGNADDVLGGFDVVVGNPPYIRYQNIGDRENVRSHLTTVDGTYLSGFSDIYSYFITHATQFLREGGRLGFITSDRWLSSQYGEHLQRFLLDNYKIRSVLRFTSQAFADALIGSTILIIETCETERERNDNRVNFLQIRDRMGLEDIATEAEQELESDKLVVADKYRLLSTSQRALRMNPKWTLYYNAPPVYFELLRGSGICELQEVAGLHLGKKVGGNTYFYHRMEEWEVLGLDEYVSPAIKASGQIEKIRFGDEAAAEWGVLNVRSLVEQALDDGHEFGDTKEQHVKEWLKRNGHEVLLEYVRQGEEEGHQHHDRCKRRDVWFDIDDFEQYRPPMAMAEFLWTQHRVVRNEAEAFVDYQFHCITPNAEIDQKLLFGILNSRLTWLARELEGREASGQAMTRSRMARYEAEQMSIVDPRAVNEEGAARIIDAVTSLIEAEEEAAEPDESELVDEARDELDKAVLAAIGAEDRAADVKRAVNVLVANRRKGAGEETEVLVDRDKEKEVIDLAGVSAARESATLSDYE